MHVKLDIRITRVATGKYNVTTEIREENLQTRPQKIKKKSRVHSTERENDPYISPWGSRTVLYSNCI